MNKGTATCHLAMVLACLTAAGCFGGSKPAFRSDVQQRAETALARGVRAQQKGNNLEARGHLTEALAAAESVEDIPLRTLALINLSRLHRLQKELERSEQYGEEALRLTEPGNPLYTEAAHEKALLMLALGRLDEAGRWALKALEHEKEGLRGSRRNLAARIALESGNSRQAASLAQVALKENRSSAHPEEEANSLRILGIVVRLEGSFAESERLLLEGLFIDKHLGKSAKIAADLEELAATTRVAGRLKDSLNYLGRAREVHRGAGRPVDFARVTEQQALLYEQTGDMDAARKLRESIPAPDQKSSATIKPSSRP